MKKQLSLFDDQRLQLEDAIHLSLTSLREYGDRYRHWTVSYSGGKDSTTALTLMAWAIKTGQIRRPESIMILYADTGMELPALKISAIKILTNLMHEDIYFQIVKPQIEHRFFVYMFGRGVPPPAPHFRWCTGKLKVVPMMEALYQRHEEIGEKFLAMNGMRIGESAVRDQRIALSCSRDGSECGQGWYHQTTPTSIADTLAPIVHWRVCHIWDWLMFYAPEYGYPTADIAEIYGGEEAEEINARTGCVGCNVATREASLDTVLKIPKWKYLRPLKRLRPLYAELRKISGRLQKDGSERYADGRLVDNPHRPGPMTMDTRRYGIEQVLGIQNDINRQATKEASPMVTLIDDDELALIYQLIDANTWPDKWDGNEPIGGSFWSRVVAEGVMQPSFFD